MNEEGNKKITKRQELLSDDVKEIISFRPHWFIRRGNMIFLVILFCLLALAFIIKYPDVIKASARLVAVNAPIMLETKGEGKLDKLLVGNGDEVSSGQLLAYIQSTGKHDEVIALQNWISSVERLIDSGRFSIIESQSPPPLTNLGELQPFYQDFQTVVKETMQVLNGGYYQKKRDALKKDLHYIYELKSYANNQKGILEQGQVLQQEEYDAYKKLADEKVIAPLELNQYKSQLLTANQSVQQAESQITNSDIASHNKSKEIMDLEKTIQDQQQKFRSSLFTLKSHVQEWIQRYIIISPENGQIEFVSFFQENQLLTSGQHVFFIQPSNTTYFAEMKTGQAGLGKIKIKQKVILRLEGYPSAEFGYVEGIVEYISNLPNERDSFTAKVTLPNGLITNYNKTIHFRNNISASAEIIADNRKLVDRLFSQLEGILTR